MTPQTKTYRGRAMDELLDKIREELGPDAVIVRRGEGAEGGVGGFFSKRVIELEATVPAQLGPGHAILDVVADDDTPELPAPLADVPLPAGEEGQADQAGTFEEHLKALLGGAAAVPPPAPVVRPVVVPEVAEAPEPPEPALSVEAMAQAFAAAPVVEEDDDAAALVAVAVEPVVPSAPAAPLSLIAPGSDAEQARDTLVDMGLTVSLADEVVTETVTTLVPFAGAGAALKPLVERTLASRIPVHVTRGAHGRVIGFVGPGGSGKTRCVARLAAAYAARTQIPVACVTLRSADEGSELRDLLADTAPNVTVHAEADVDAASARIEALRQTSLVVLDTPGVSPRAEAEMRVLAAELAQLRADELHLAVPATIAPRPARELVMGTRSLKPCAIALTHADETDALGTVVDLAIDSGLPLSFLGRGQGVTSGLRPADAGELATALLAA